MTPGNFAILGVAGYIAPRHLKAIKDVGGKLLAAADPRDSVGVLDQYAPDVRFFTEIERLDRHLEKLRRGPVETRLDYLTVCTPNYLHDAHCRLGLRLGASVICEKPLVNNPWNLDALEALEQETGGKIFTVLQLRVHPKLVELRERLRASGKSMHEVDLSYVTSRGPWYDVSWKASIEKSGGIPTNIGIHFFDLLIWLFGAVKKVQVHLNENRRCGGTVELERARVRWFLSIESSDLPADNAGRPTYRSITVDGAEVEFSDGFGDLHTRVYEDVLGGGGFRIPDARPSVELVHRIRTAPAETPGAGAHPMVKKHRGTP